MVKKSVILLLLANGLFFQSVRSGFVVKWFKYSCMSAVIYGEYHKLINKNISRAESYKSGFFIPTIVPFALLHNAVCDRQNRFNIQKYCCCKSVNNF